MAPGHGRHDEDHRSGRIGILRAGVLGANDGLVSTASLIVGVAAAGSPASGILIAGVAGLVAGSMSMAAGEYVSVSSQADTEEADLARERKELETDPEGEHAELAGIYVSRGLDPALARSVAEQLMKHDALGAHARDELGLSERQRAQPIAAAVASALSFAAGAALPLLVVLAAPAGTLISCVLLSSIALLATLGALAAWVGGANPLTGAVRVVFWGAFAMAITWAIGAFFGTVV